MLKNLAWLSEAENLDIELAQSRDEGRRVFLLLDKAERIRDLSPDDPQREILAARLYDKVVQAPFVEDYAYVEPSDLEGIRKERTGGDDVLHVVADDDAAYDRIYGAWLGRCCGCLLGAPVETWIRRRILGLLKETGNYPIRTYLSSAIPEVLRTKYDIDDARRTYGNEKASWIDNVSCMPEDDDTNYTLIALKVLETRGFGFTSEDVAEVWLDSLPFTRVCTAERVAYRNFTQRIAPPASASHRNPYREWIGAQIRADLYGYVTPGDPARGAALAFRDASISHTRNGIYGAMFVAAMLSEAAVTRDVERIVRAGLAQIPARSRLHERISKTLADWTAGMSWEKALDALHDDYYEEDPYDWCHTIPNAAIVVVALLHGGLDLGTSLGIAVSAGFDTDCNGATVGSVVGLALGAKALPASWMAPLNDRIRTGVDGLGSVAISDVAARTVARAGKAADLRSTSGSR